MKIRINYYVTSGTFLDNFENTTQTWRLESTTTLQQWPPGRVHFLPHMHNLNKLGRCLLYDARYQISRLNALWFQTKRCLTFSFRKSVWPRYATNRSNRTLIKEGQIRIIPAQFGQNPGSSLGGELLTTHAGWRLSNDHNSSLWAFGSGELNKHVLRCSFLLFSCPFCTNPLKVVQLAIISPCSHKNLFFSGKLIFSQAYERRRSRWRIWQFILTSLHAAHFFMLLLSPAEL